MKRQLLASLLTVALIGQSAPGVAKAPQTWDGLVRVKSKRLDLVYLRPQADFRGYSKIMLDSPQVAFRKNWQRDLNSTSAARVTDDEVRSMLDQAGAALKEAFAAAFRKEGYEIVSSSGPDVLRVSLGIANLSVTAPDKLTSARARTYAREAGEATLAVEARDSISGELVGRAVDQETAGDGAPLLRTSTSNRSDFERLFANWATISVKGLNELKARSPVNADGASAR